MNQFPALLINESAALECAPRPGAQTFAGSGDVLPHTYQFSPGLSGIAGMAFWSRYYEMNSTSLRPWDGAALFPGSMQSPQTGGDQTAQAVEDAIVAERNRLARELHDAVTQTLFAASLIAEVLPDLWDMDEGEARRSTDELRQLTRGALAEMRTLLFELRPAALNQARLPDLLRQLSEALIGRKRLPIRLEVEGECEIPCDIKVEIYRIAQESLNNVVKYARASQVDIKVRLTNEQVHMEIRDNGAGFDPASVKPTSLGLRIMAERAEAIHAQLQVTSQPGIGTMVSLDWHK